MRGALEKHAQRTELKSNQLTYLFKLISLLSPQLLFGSCFFVRFGLSYCIKDEIWLVVDDFHDVLFEGALVDVESLHVPLHQQPYLLIAWGLASLDGLQTELNRNLTQMLLLLQKCSSHFRLLLSCFVSLLLSHGLWLSLLLSDRDGVTAISIACAEEMLFIALLGVQRRVKVGVKLAHFL